MIIIQKHPEFFTDEPRNPVKDSETFEFKAIVLNNVNNAGVINAKIAVR